MSACSEVIPCSLSGRPDRSLRRARGLIACHSWSRTRRIAAVRSVRRPFVQDFRGAARRLCIACRRGLGPFL